ncbi:MAG: HEPN domain-containing protein [Candidatus Methylomirabilia bacterium]
MRNDRAARSYLADAEIILREAEGSQRAEHYHRVVRKCQEAAELAIKGLFRLWGIEYPKSHLLGRLIKKELARRKVLDRKAADRLAYDSDSLALDREPAFYGSPDGVPASQLFDAEDGGDALAKARRVLDTVRAAIDRYGPD